MSTALDSRLVGFARALRGHGVIVGTSEIVDAGAAAHVLGLDDRGRLAPGLRADLVLLDAPDWRHLAYHFAGDVVHSVIRGGHVVHTRA